MAGQNTINELKALKNDLEEAKLKEEAKSIKAQRKADELEGRLGAVKETLRLWGALEGQKTLDEALKASGITATLEPAGSGSMQTEASTASPAPSDHDTANPHTY